MVKIDCELVYVLWLNNVHDRTEAYNPVAVCGEIIPLLAWEQAQRAPEPYRDGTYHLVYRADSPIKWYNAQPGPESIFAPPYGITTAVIQSRADLQPGITQVREVLIWEQATDPVTAEMRETAAAIIARLGH